MCCFAEFLVVLVYVCKYFTFCFGFPLCVASPPFYWNPCFMETLFGSILEFFIDLLLISAFLHVLVHLKSSPSLVESKINPQSGALNHVKGFKVY